MRRASSTRHPSGSRARRTRPISNLARIAYRERVTDRALPRVLGVGALIAYGVGDILGAGIYALVGEVAARAGSAAWLSFAIATGIAAFTALSYAELGSRFPRSGGEAWFVQRAFGREGPALFVGWLVLASGVVSSATVAWGFAGYVSALAPSVPEPAVVIGFLLGLALIAYRGMRESSFANIVCTLVEVCGLLLVVVAGLIFLGGEVPASAPAPEAASFVGWKRVLQGSAIAYFAFIGFEDLIKASEEARNPERAVPVAILVALAVCGVLYVSVAWVSLGVLGARALADTPAPLLDVVHRAAPAVPSVTFIGVALFAVTNTALVNFVMGSRLLYGMSRQGLLPAWFATLHPTRRTPHHAVWAILAAATALALSGTLARLAGATAALVLSVFVTVNVSLLKVGPRADAGFRIPRAVPVLGAAGSLGLMTFVEAEAFLTAAGVATLGLVIVWARRVRPGR